MEKRSLLFGIGSGIILATLVIQVSSQPIPPAKPVTPPPPAQSASLSQQQVVDWGKKHGFVVVNQAEWQAQQQKLKERESKPAPQPSPQPVEPTTVIYISSGLSVSQMESMLVKTGLLPKNSRFAELIGGRGLSRKIHSGAYTFKGKPTEETIIAELTK